MGYLDDLLASDERVLLVAHRHVLALVLQTALYVLGTILLVALGVVLYLVLPAAEGIALVICLAAALVPLSVAVYRFLRWRSEQYVVTTYRIIQVEGIINKRTFDSALEKVNDVLMTQSLFGRIFGYGNINIITGSDVGINELSGIADPFAFKRELMAAKLQLRDEDDRPQRTATHENSRLVAALDELRASGVISDAEYAERRRRLGSEG